MNFNKNQARGSRGKFVKNNFLSKFLREWDNFWKNVAKKLGI